VHQLPIIQWVPEKAGTPAPKHRRSLCEEGQPIGEEYTLALAVRYYLSFRQKSPVVVNLSTSRVIEDISRKAGVKLLRTKVGEINVSRKMLETGSKIGGEGNGGIIVTDTHACRDSFTGMALILEYLARSSKKVSQLKQELPQYKMIKEKVKAGFSDRKRIMNLVKSKFNKGEINTEDGLRIDYPDFWLIEGRDENLIGSVYSEIKEQL